MTLTIATGNGHNEQSLIDWIRDSNADSFGASETQRLEESFDNLKAYRQIVAGQGWAEERNRARSSRIVTLKSLENIGELTRLASEKVPGAERVAPDRVLLMSAFKHRAARLAGWDGIGHYHIHPDAGPAALRGERGRDHPILREYREAMRTTIRYMKVGMKDGLLPILTGDLQLPADVDLPWAPVDVFAGMMRMRFVNDKIDYIFWHRSLRLDPGSLKKRKLFDHVGLAVGLVPDMRMADR